MDPNTTMIDVDIFKIKQKYRTNADLDMGYLEFMQDIIKFFEVDRIFLGMKSVLRDECVPLMECLPNGVTNFFGEVTSFDNFSKFTAVAISETEQKYIDFCADHNYFTAENYDELSEVLSQMGYEKSNLGEVSECVLFCMQSNEAFSYFILERYGDHKTPWSEDLRLVIADVYDLSRMKVYINVLENRLYNDMRIKAEIVENEKIPVCIVDNIQNRILYYNEAMEDCIPEIGLGAYYFDLFDEKETSIEVYSDSIRSQKNQDGTMSYWIKKSLPFQLLDGTNVCMIYMKNTQDYIDEMIGIDLLTSAYSLKGFSEAYDKLLLDEVRPTNYMLCAIDINKFKYINDRYTFEVGNRILQKVSTVLNHFMRCGEFFCRINEDKFAFILQCNTESEVKARLEELFKKLDEMKDEHFLDMKLTFVCGVTNINKELPINLLLDQANNARKMAKGSHKNMISFFDKETEERIKEEVRIEQRIPSAVKNNEFIPFLQPKFDLRTMEICGAEALVRWLTPTGMIFPDQFIPLFEKDGFIDTLDFIVYKQVMIHIRDCLDEGLPVYPISLNVSRNHIQNKNFVTQLMELINTYAVPIDLLELEVTESIFIEDRELLKYFIDNIKRPKLKVSIDDFGSAYSSLQLLKDVDIDILKIDKGFLNNIDFSNEHQYTKDEVVLTNIIRLARDLKCKVICEGIETEDQIELLKGIGCEYGQGFVFSRPIPIEEYKELFLKS